MFALRSFMIYNSSRPGAHLREQESRPDSLIAYSRAIAPPACGMSRQSIPAKRSATDAQEAAWIADEDRFVLRQAKKKAVLRAKGGRASPIDWLTVTLCVIDPERNVLDDEVDMEEVDMEEVDVMEPEGVLEGLDESGLKELEKSIESYVTLESSRSNLEYWQVSSAVNSNMFGAC